MTGIANTTASGHHYLPTIVVVGPCASGKTTLARELGRAGIPVRICGQEHSSIKDFWRTMNPDVLVVLSIDLQTLRTRRHESWPEHLFFVQQLRLASAFASADLVIDTTRESPQQAADLVRRHLDRHPCSPSGPRHLS
jgi:adenylate kinase family enzyme